MRGDESRGHVIVTGAASGIGLATATLLLEEGLKVAIFDKDEWALASVEHKLKQLGPVFACHVDITNEVSIKDSIQTSASELGPVAGVVNSAGIARDIPFLQTTAELFRTIYEINVIGSFIVAREAALAMIASNTAGSIVNLASVSGIKGNLGRSAYGASKGAIITLTKVMAVELAAHNIRVNAVAPGPVDTPMVKGLHTPDTREMWTRTVPQKRYAEPLEIAHAIAFLLHPQKSSFITGQIIAVDGGFEAGGLIG